MAQPPELPHSGFVRLKRFLPLIGFGRSTLWRMVSEGRFPAPVKLGPRITVWRAEDVSDFIAEGRWPLTGPKSASNSDRLCPQRSEPD
ncbi:MAG: AlpA family phage regulatory protein [Bauldia sp.]